MGASTPGRTPNACNGRCTWLASSTATTRNSHRQLNSGDCNTPKTTDSVSEKRSRVALAAEYVERYEREILDQIDLRPIVAEMPDDAATTLLCVERDATACHRSLIARRIAQEFGLPVRHLPLSEDSPRF